MGRWGMVALALVLPAASAMAGPYGGSAGRCPSALVGKVQRCTVAGEDGSTFTECLRFSGAGAVSGKLEMQSDLLQTTLGCSCKPIGTAAKPTFASSTGFVCTGSAGVSFEGRIAKDGTVPRGSVVNDRGTAYVFSCTIDAACTP